MGLSYQEPWYISILPSPVGVPVNHPTARADTFVPTILVHLPRTNEGIGAVEASSISLVDIVVLNTLPPSFQLLHGSHLLGLCFSHFSFGQAVLRCQLRFPLPHTTQIDATLHPFSRMRQLWSNWFVTKPQFLQGALIPTRESCAYRPRGK